MKGQVISLDKVNDSVFSSGSLGKGMAIIPSEGKIYAPADGTISAFFETGHAIGVTSSMALKSWYMSELIQLI